MSLRRGLALAAGLLAAGCGYAYRADGTGYVAHRASPLMLWSQPGPSRAAAPAPDRTVAEQDCTAPISVPTANLKCR